MLMFSRRLPHRLETNRLSAALAKAPPEIDLTASNPTVAGFTYSPEILQALTDPRALVYEPDPRGLDGARAEVAQYYRARGVTLLA